jgi:hypothetical protein
MQGQSLRAALAGGEVAARPLFFEWNGVWNRGVRDGDGKLMRRRDTMMFVDLATDPLELRESSGAAPHPELVRALDAYETDGARRRASLAAPEPTPVAPGVADALRALGYVQ